MDEEQREELIRRLQKGEELSPEWARILFPPEKREYELVYHGKEREEDVIASTLAVPLQKVRTFGKNGDGWHNKLIFGDNLQVMKSLLDLKRAGELCNADGTRGSGLFTSILRLLRNASSVGPKMRVHIRTKYQELASLSSCGNASYHPRIARR